MAMARLVVFFSVHPGQRFEGAFVYGSTVRGDARPGSDVDVCLIVREGEPSWARRRQLSDVEFLLGKPPATEAA